MKKVIEFLKASWVVIWWAGFSLLLWFPIFITGMFSKTGRLAFRLAQAWVWVGKTICFTRVEHSLSDKIDPNKSYILVSNHQSLLDIPSLMLMGIQFRWVLKRELGFIPLFGWALWGAKHVFVDRSKPKAALKNLNKSLSDLPSGVSVAIFPEGTRSDTGVLGEFKVGGFLAAVSTGLDVVPITINGSWRIMPNKKSMNFFPGKVQVIASDPIDVSNYSKREMSKLMADTKEIIQGNLNPDYPNS